MFKLLMSWKILKGLSSVEQNTSVESAIVVYVVMKIYFIPKSWTMIQKHKLCLLHKSKNIALQA